MRYRNISDAPISVGNINGTISVAPGEEILTAPKFAQALVDDGLLESVVEKKKTTKSSTPRGDD